MSNTVEDSVEIFAPEPPGMKAQPDRSTDLDGDGVDLDLALRFLIGLLALSGDEAARRLQETQHQLKKDPTRWAAGFPAAEKPLRRQAWYLGVGLMRRGHMRLRSRLRRSYNLSRRMAGRVSAASNRWGISTLTGPLRRPLAAKIGRWREEAARIISEGELEELQGRALVAGTLETLTLEVMDEIAESPEMQIFVQELIGQQGVGLATSMVDNARSVTLTADDTAEALLRWLMRRKPRRELPPSPVEGQPQTMYEPKARVEQGMPDAD
jgi:hypothetical protein